MEKQLKYSTNSMQTSKREGFSTSLGVMAATLGSAVGLGNIWKFPYITGENGGAAFLFVYLICVSIVGLTVMISEFIIGRRGNAAAVGAFKNLTPGKPWYLTGVAGVISCSLIMFYYTTVAGWVFAYVFKSLGADLATKDPNVIKQVFADFTGSIWAPLFWQWVVLITVGIIILAGVKKGIERMTKTLLPILFVLLIISDIRALTLPGASAGLKFIFEPDFSKITGVTVLAALGLSFFKLSVGMGTMTTYGSYMGKNENLPATAARVMVSDTLVSIMAGIAIFPAVFAFGFKPDAGPSLLFMTIPMVFNSMPFGKVFLALFFMLSSIAAIGAMISLLEVPVAYLTEERKWSRTAATVASALTIALVGSTATLSNGILSDFHLFGKTMFDLFDFTSSNILLPLVGIALTIYVGWVLGPRAVYNEATNEGALKNRPLVRFFLFIVRYLAPPAIFVILLNGLGLFS